MRRSISTRGLRNDTETGHVMSKRVAGRTGSATCSVQSPKRSWLLVLAPVLGLVLLFGVWSALPPPTVIAAQAQAAQAQAQVHSKARSQDGQGLVPGAAGSSAFGSSTGSPAQVSTGRALVKQSKEQIRGLHKGGTGKASIRGSGGGSHSSSGGAGGSDSKAMSGQQGAPPASARVVVVGGGLAGLTAALTAAEQLAAANGTASGGANGSGVYEVDVLVVEKMPRLGGNSAKASSGMNALNPQGGDSEVRDRAVMCQVVVHVNMCAWWAHVMTASRRSGRSAICKHLPPLLPNLACRRLLPQPLFSSDTLSSGGGASVPELVQRLVVGDGLKAARQPCK